MNVGAIVFATEKTDTLREILFRPMIDTVIKAVKNADIRNICVIAEENISQIEKHFENSDIKVFTSVQEATDAVGTDIIVFLRGNKPFIDSVSISGALAMHAKDGNDMTVISEDSTAFCLSREAIGKAGIKTDIYASANKNINLSAETAEDFINISETMRLSVLAGLIENGISIPCTDGIIIEADCKIGNGTTILPNTIIRGKTSIGEGCTIGPSSYIENAEIGSGVKFTTSHIRSAKIMNNADIGPFAHIRPDALIGDNVHLGNFVEVKNSVIDTGTKVSHLTYVGDSDVGKNVNFGCGVVTVNFSGKTKSRTIIKDSAFIGCNTNLIAPVTVGKNSYTAAGSTITEDVPDNTLAIAREKQTNKEGWVKKNQPYRKKV